MQCLDAGCGRRDEYALSDLPGGTAASFKLKGKEYLRKDAQLVRACLNQRIRLVHKQSAQVACR